jgi:hypothetical protein
MAQLGDFVRAKVLIRRAARAFGPKERVARAKCVIAEAEIALASRDLSWPAKTLSEARRILEEHGDQGNSAHAQYLEIRRLVLIGHLDQAERILTGLDPTRIPPALTTVHELLVAGIAMRRLEAKTARIALDRARQAANHAKIPALSAEVESAVLVLNTPAARLITRDEERLLLPDAVETLLTSDILVIDACRSAVCHTRTVISLARRPVLFSLARALGEAWPEDVSRSTLIVRGFQAKFVDESHRARLRVEIGRLRTMLRAVADIHATQHGFTLVPHHARQVALLVHFADEEHTEVLALLADGESWSSSALALALGISQRTVQRALDSLALAGKVQACGQGRARRWIIPPIPGFATPLLLSASLPSD